LEVLLKNCEDAYGFPPYENLKEFLFCTGGIDLREKEHEIIRQALGTFRRSKSARKIWNGGVASRHTSTHGLPKTVLAIATDLPSLLSWKRWGLDVR